MKNVNCLVMDLSEFNDTLSVSTNGMVAAVVEGCEWFYVQEEGYGDVDDYVLDDLSNYLNKRINKVYVDSTEMVAILALD